MSSGPTTLVGNLQVADGYIDEAWLFSDELNDYERRLLNTAQQSIQIIIQRKAEHAS